MRVFILFSLLWVAVQAAYDAMETEDSLWWISCGVDDSSVRIGANVYRGDADLRLGASSSLTLPAPNNTVIPSLYQNASAWNTTTPYAFNLSVTGSPTHTYRVRLHFADPNSTEAGQRVFSITSNDEVLDASLDIFAEAGQVNRER
jgi:hypothetical protein